MGGEKMDIRKARTAPQKAIMYQIHLSTVSGKRLKA